MACETCDLEAFGGKTGPLFLKLPVFLEAMPDFINEAMTLLRFVAITDLDLTVLCVADTALLEEVEGRIRKPRKPSLVGGAETVFVDVMVVSPPILFEYGIFGISMFKSLTLLITPLVPLGKVTDGLTDLDITVAGVADVLTSASLAFLSSGCSIPDLRHLAILQEGHFEGGIGHELFSPTHWRSFLGQFLLKKIVHPGQTKALHPFLTEGWRSPQTTQAVAAS